MYNKINPAAFLFLSAILSCSGCVGMNTSSGKGGYYGGENYADKSEREYNEGVRLNDLGYEMDRQNNPEALLYYKQSAEIGNPSGLYNMGVLYWKGKYVKKDIAIAGDYFRKGAKKGSVDAMFAFGLYKIEHGDGKEDFEIGLSWVKRAADFSHKGAREYLKTEFREKYGYTPKLYKNDEVKPKRQKASAAEKREQKVNEVPAIPDEVPVVPREVEKL